MATAAAATVTQMVTAVSYHRTYTFTTVADEIYKVAEPVTVTETVTQPAPVCK